MSQETKPARKSSTLASRRLNEITGYAGSLLAACSIIMWSVFNTFLNFLTYRADTAGGQDWKTTAVLVLVLCVLPFFLGLAILAKTLNRIAPKTEQEK